jgi:hypothetical protein
VILISDLHDYVRDVHVQLLSRGFILLSFFEHPLYIPRSSHNIQNLLCTWQLINCTGGDDTSVAHAGAERYLAVISDEDTAPVQNL